MAQVSVAFITREREDGDWEVIFRTPDEKESLLGVFESESLAEEFVVNVALTRLENILPTFGGRLVSCEVSPSA